jgi:hypothetical protein|nr:MAG TPA: head closure knob [Caudoviricetes sp.]
MDITYFQKINNTYNSKSKQETDLYLLNRQIDNNFDGNIDYHVVKRNGEPFELIIVKDTDGNTFKKKIKSKNSQPFNLGDYIEWQGQMWLVTRLDPDDKANHSGYMYLCTVPLRWQNSEGKIIERFAYSEDFTKYSAGTTGNNFLVIGDNQYGLTLPVDSETKKLARDMRFAIDFDDSDKPDTYILSNRKVNLNNYEYFNRGGTIILTLSFDAFKSDCDKLVDFGDDKKVWICDYKEPQNQETNTDDWHLEIEYSSLKIKPTNKVSTITAQLYDKDDNELIDGIEYEWTITSNVDEYLTIKKNGNTLNISLAKNCTAYGEKIIVCCMSKYTGQSSEIELEVAEVW